MTAVALISVIFTAREAQLVYEHLWTAFNSGDLTREEGDGTMRAFNTLGQAMAKAGVHSQACSTNAGSPA